MAKEKTFGLEIIGNITTNHIQIIDINATSNTSNLLMSEIFKDKCFKPTAASAEGMHKQKHFYGFQWTNVKCQLSLEIGFGI